MKKLVRILLTLTLALALLVPSVVLAYTYSASMIVTESASNDYVMLPIIAGIDNQYLADGGYILSSGLDTRVLEASAERPHMLSDDKTLFGAPISADESSSFSYTLGNDVLDDFYIVTGYDGYITVSDSATLDMEDSFTVEIKGWVDTSSGSNKNLMYRQNSFRLYIQAEGSIRAAILSAGDVEDLAVTATGITTGVHTVKVTADGVDFKIYIDTVEKDTISLGANSVPDSGNSYTFMQNNCLAYAEYIRLWTSE